MEIKLEHVTKKIKGVPVLQDVTKTFTGGCIYGLSGKNGCGKTMLMRTMAGLIYPTSGVVKINGKTLGKDISFPPSMGLLIENPAFLRGYTGLENLEILAKVQGGVPQDEIRATLEQVELPPTTDGSITSIRLACVSGLELRLQLWESRILSCWMNRSMRSMRKVSV